MRTLEALPTRTGPVSYPCTCCGSPVEREQVYCARCLQAIRARKPGSDRFVDHIGAEIDRAA